MKGGKYRGAFSSFIILGLFGAIVAVIWQGVNLIAAGELEVGELFSFVIYSGFIGGSIGGFANVYASIQKAIGATEELMEILEEPTEDLKEEETTTRLSGFKGKISFVDLSFHYPSRPDQEVLRGVSFEAMPGEQIALVGPSGAGKSTVVNLILRFYTPTAGQLYFDDKEARHYGLSELRNQMAVVPQDVFLFGGSIRENIAYGNPGASEDEIKEAAQKANAWQFINDFTEGLDTLVGERGRS
ncbi:MAG: ABC transporter ATP-binding protein [Owenweeksia sp.]|nr:ABC transporter ATP-binding protein [Owenweeksia sp.]